jgi:exonuclease SbcC
MRVENVTLENVKSYAGPTTIEFGEGVHAVLGENGAGKSTIPEAIGFCLFGATPPHATQEELVRDGETSGTIRVEITLGGTHYRLRRKVGGTNPKIVNLTDDAELTIDTVGEYEEWLRAKFGVPDSLELSDLWSNCIGVPQTDFISDFTDSETDRVETFDELLGIDAYRDAYKDLVDLPKAIKTDAENILNDINRLDGEIASLPEDREAAAELRDRIDSLEATIASKREEKAAVEAELAVQNAYEDSDDHAGNRLAQLDGEVSRAASTVEGRIEDREDAREAQAVVERTEAAHEAYTEASEELDRLEERRAERQALVEERTNKKERLGELNGKVNEAQSRVETVEGAKETVECLRHIPEINEALQRDIARLYLDQSELEAACETIETAPDEIERHEQETDRIKEEIERIEGLEDTADQLQPLTEHKSSLEAEITQKSDRIDELEDQIEVIKQAQTGDGGGDDDAICPTCGQNLADGGHEELIQTHRETIVEIEDDIATLREQVGTLEDEIEAAQNAQGELDRLPQLRQQQQQAEDKAEETREVLQEARETRDRLQREQNWAERLDAYRQQTIAPQLNKYQAAKGTLEATDDPENPVEAVEAAHEEVKAKLEAVVDEIERINDDLDAYDGVEEEIGRVKDRLKANEDEHAEYEKHIDDAEALAERREAVQTAINSLHDTAREHYRTRAYKRLAEERYDEAEQHRLETKVSDLSGEIGNHRGTLNTKQSNLTELEAEIEALEAKHKTRQKKAAELRELRRDLAFAKFTRNSIKEAGPKMRELVAGKVSERANEIYQSLRGTGTERLEWDKTYLVTIHDRGHTKTFGQLSGGEKMAAALSIRLSLLERLATVDMAFLDEPTKNLDQAKKRNLVDHLETIDSLDQLTVISHDATFEAMTEFAIQLEKDEETRVVAD